MKELLHTPIFNVMELDEVEDDFKPIGIKAPDWVSIIVEKDNKFLVVKQLRFGLNMKTIEFPSGTVEEGEDARKAAARELFEETGIVLDADNLEYINSCNPNPAFMMNTKYTFYVNLNKVRYTQVEQHLDEHEHIEYFWEDKWFLTEAFSGASLKCPAMFGSSLLAYWNYKGVFKGLRNLSYSMQK